MLPEHARGSDRLSVGVQLELQESGVGTTNWAVDRFDEDQVNWVRRRSGIAQPQLADFRRHLVTPYSHTEVYGNLITNAGWTLIMSGFAGGAITKFSSTVGRLGIGDSNTAEAVTDTQLGASTNKLYKFAGAAFTLGTRTMQLVCTFGATDANFPWNEFGIDQGTSDGTTVTAVFLNHKANIAQGSKASGQVWAATATINFT